MRHCSRCGVQMADDPEVQPPFVCYRCEMAEQRAEYETTKQWIERTLAGATPELLAEIDREMPMAKFCRGVLAAAVEKRQKQRRGY